MQQLRGDDVRILSADAAVGGAEIDKHDKWKVNRNWGGVECQGLTATLIKRAAVRDHLL